MGLNNFSKLLITGGSGFLGWNLATYAVKFYDVSFTYGRHPLMIEGCREYHLDLQSQAEIEDTVDDIRPEIIIHTAALADADVCEKRRSKAYEINVAATGYLAKCAEELGCRFVYISTDLVFDGQKGQYTETDVPKPVNYYGETKLLGEQHVKENSTDYLIVRMAIMYGTGNGINGCFTDWIRDGLEHEKPVRLYTDQYRTPLFIHDGVRALLELLKQPVKNEIFHLAGKERVKRYDFGKTFAETFDYDAQYLHPATIRDSESEAVRGRDCSLNNEKIQQLLSFQISDVRNGLQKMKQKILRHNP